MMASTTQTQTQTQKNQIAASVNLRSSRLMKEWLEIQKCPVANASISPLNDENLNEWHGNILGTENSEWDGIVVHFAITFPAEYPILPPRVRLFSFIPHLNVQARGGMWEVCLSMLETQPLGSVTTPYQYWSSAFSVRSILVQMTSFLLSEDRQTQMASAPNIQRTRTEAMQFRCSTCPHTFNHPHPPLPCSTEIQKAPLSFPCVEVSGEFVQHLQSRILQRRMKQHQEYLEKESHQQETELDVKNDNENNHDQEEMKENEGVEEGKMPSSSSSSSSLGVSTKEQPQPKQQPKQQEEEVWHVVGKKSHNFNTNTNHLQSKKFSSTTQQSTQSSASAQVVDPTKSEGNLFCVLEEAKILTNYKFECSRCHKKLNDADFTRSQLHKGDERKCLKCVQQQQQQLQKNCPSTPVPPAKPVSLIPGASSSMILLPTNGKFASKVLNKKTSNNNNTTTKPKKVDSLNGVTKVVPTNEESKVEKDSSSSSTTTQDLLSTTLPASNLEPEYLGEWKNIWRSSPETSNETNSNMAVFNTLNRDTACILLSYLQLADILSLGSCCRGTASLCDDWLVWRDLFRRRFPRTALTPIGPNSSWKTAFMLEVNGLSQALSCFTSFSTKSDSVLGFPVSFTTNPKTGCLDYATSTFDILSFDSFMQGNVRKTMWGERFTDFLPIYIDQDHFIRGLPQLVRVSRKIVQTGLLNLPKHSTHNNYNNHNNHNNKHHSKNALKDEIPEGGNWMPRNDPEMILTLLTKMMNTQVVLLCDKGIAASEVALMGYCQLHRLLMAVVDHFPNLRALIRTRLEDFARKPETRVKTYTPSLGELMAMLSVSDTYSWRQLSLAYLGESFDRSVLWACSKDPSLAEVTVGDESRLSKYLTTQRVSMRLTLFHAVFLNLLVQGGGSKSKLEDCADRYDTFQGRPPLYLRREWQKMVKSILEFETWPQFFSISGVPLPSKTFLLTTLEQAVKNSLKKGYHSRDTVFQNVMKSGVSRILLKGETYSAAPNLKRIKMIESWRYDGDTIFLDASCLVYGFDGNCLATVDYATTGAYTHTSTGSPVLFIEHSGDIVDHNLHKGEHSIHIEVSLIPTNVAALFFTVSAWTTTLNDIYQPSAQLYDSMSDTEMCRYKLEDQNTGDKTAVIMCKLHRPSVGGRWQLTSIGHVGYGRAGNYSPIHRDIKQFL